MNDSISSTALLGIVFIVLKLCKVINWSWWWVTAPFWAAFAIALVGVIAICIWFTVTHLWGVYKDRSKRNGR